MCILKINFSFYPSTESQSRKHVNCCKTKNQTFLYLFLEIHQLFALRVQYITPHLPRCSCTATRCHFHVRVGTGTNQPQTLPIHSFDPPVASLKSSNPPRAHVGTYTPWTAPRMRCETPTILPPKRGEFGDTTTDASARGGDRIRGGVRLGGPSPSSGALVHCFLPPLLPSLPVHRQLRWPATHTHLT